MPVEMKMWRMGDGGTPRPLAHTSMSSEAQLQAFLAEDPTILGEPLLVIGREVPTPYGTRIDILAMDVEGNLHGPDFETSAIKGLTVAKPRRVRSAQASPRPVGAR